MITYGRDEVVLEGDPATLVAEFGMIAHLLRKALLYECNDKFEAETVRKMMDVAYNFWKEEETC